jgi:hypothetical protein
MYSSNTKVKWKALKAAQRLVFCCKTPLDHIMYASMADAYRVLMFEEDDDPMAEIKFWVFEFCQNVIQLYIDDIANPTEESIKCDVPWWNWFMDDQMLTALRDVALDMGVPDEPGVGTVVASILEQLQNPTPGDE